MGGPAGTEPERRPRETRIEDRREYLRDSLLDQPVQAGRDGRFILPLLP
jgi:hypothetical protein